jgi:peptide/nickel transport system substrate-binding protein
LADIRDSAKERDVINQMLQVMHDDPPWIFMYMQPDFYGVSNRVEWQARRDEQIIVNNVTIK